MRQGNALEAELVFTFPLASVQAMAGSASLAASLTRAKTMSPATRFGRLLRVTPSKAKASRLAAKGPLMSTLQASPYRSVITPMTESPTAGMYLQHLALLIFYAFESPGLQPLCYNKDS